MTHQEDLEWLSADDLVLEQAPQRNSQVVLAPRGRQHESELLPPMVDGDDPDWLRIELAAPPVPTKIGVTEAQHGHLGVARAGGLLPIRPAPELREQAQTGTQSPPPRTEIRALSGERRVAQLETQRLLLSMFVGALLAGAAALYTGVIKPEAGRQRQLIAQLSQLNAQQRSEQERQLGRLTSRISELDAQFVVIQSKLNAQGHTEDVPPSKSPRSSAPTQPALKEPPQSSAPKQVLPENAAAPQPVAMKEASTRATSPSAPEQVPVTEPPQSAAPIEEPSAPTPVEAPKPPSLRDAMRAATSVDANKPPIAKEAPQPPPPSEPPAMSKPGCDRNDPLCGDLN